MPRFTSRTLLALGFALVIWASAFAGIRALRRRTVTFPARRALGGDWRSALSRDFSRSACLRSVGVCAAGRTTTRLYAISVLAIGIAWIWLNEVPKPLSLGGGLIALGGVVLVNTLGKEKPVRAATQLVTDAIN